MHPLMRLSLILIFFSMAFAFNGETSLLQKNCLEDKIVPEIKSTILAKIQYVN